MKNPATKISHLDRRIEPRDQESFNFAKRLDFPYGQIDPVLDWCRNSLGGDWRWQIAESASDRRPGNYIFYFDHERDYLMFCLKWA
jgi:hypothetical protein